MILFIADKVSSWLIRQNAIGKEDKELYEYAVHSFTVSAIPVLLFLLFGGIVGMLYESILIILPFMLLRKYSGGYHAKYAWLCLVISSSLLGICLFMVRQSKYGPLWDAAFLLSLVSLGIHSPVDSENRKLDMQEAKVYRKTVIILEVIFTLIYVICIICGKSNAAICIVAGTVLSAGLQVPCVMKKMIERIRKGRI